ncbi:MAG: DUF3300 domain-containing protein [Desulfuromusa sp.]|jgi:hypothetical protein|nr:DUF3300 domain-containing protein [Desulfuromusa sp.]
MNVTTIFKLFLGLIIIPSFAFFFTFNPQPAQAQDSGNQDQAERYSEEELAQMLAPIALYPDALLSQILMASTYPIEVIEADRWLRENRELTGDTLDGELLNKGWDPSVKAICHFPSSLALMSERIAETTNLGNAFLAQETEVMGMIQKLRSGAYEQGNLKTTAEQKVIVEKETIIIEPANPRAVYLPYYDPYYVYGPWWWSPGYAPYYWGPVGANIGVGISFWPGVYFGISFSSWSYFDWNRRYVYIDLHKRPRFVRHDRWITTSGRWLHASSHRRGVAYRDMSTARKYGQSPQRSIIFRHDVRSFPEPHRLEQKQPGKVQTRTNRYRQEQQRVGRNIKDQGKITYKAQERQNVNMEKQTKQRKKMNPVRPENIRQERIQIAPVPQKQKRLEQPERLKHKKQQTSSEGISNQLQDDNQERQSSERGRDDRRSLKGVNNDDRNGTFRR